MVWRVHESFPAPLPGRMIIFGIMFRGLRKLAPRLISGNPPGCPEVLTITDGLADRGWSLRVILMFKV